MVSERIKLSATDPLVGDLVFEGTGDDGDTGELVGFRCGMLPDQTIEIPVPRLGQKGKDRVKKWETTSSQNVKQLAESDLPNHTIFDVVMPLPGFDVDYPGGRIGELYLEIMRADGLDAHRMRRDQRYVLIISFLLMSLTKLREYSLPGSYRRIINRPDHAGWQHIHYTDPDIALVQSDEDRILGLNPAAANEVEGKFRALRIELTLGASAYATMALREVTREETSVWHQIGLTLKGEDQEFKGVGAGGDGRIAFGEVDDAQLEGEGDVATSGDVP